MEAGTPSMNLLSLVWSYLERQLTQEYLDLERFLGQEYPNLEGHPNCVHQRILLERTY